MSQSRFCKKEKTDVAQAFALWQQRQPGLRLVAHEREVLSDMLDDLFGYQLLQLGVLGGDLHHLERCPVRRKTLIAAAAAEVAAEGLLIGDPQHLPVASDSVDAMVLPHTLDFSPDPHQVLREVERVLIAEGRVIIIGFNPFSLWGAWRIFAHRRGLVPWCGHFLSYPRVSDWLSLMGLEVERMDVLEFRPPTRSERLDVMERIGRRTLPMFAGVYIVRAVKRVARVRPLRDSWPRLRAMGPRAIEPTVREIKNV